MEDLTKNISKAERCGGSNKNISKAERSRGSNKKHIKNRDVEDLTKKISI